MRAIAVPLCAIVGSRDPFVVDARALAARVPHAETTIVPGAGPCDSGSSAPWSVRTASRMPSSATGKARRFAFVSVPALGERVIS